jgi:hypothetical protein
VAHSASYRNARSRAFLRRVRTDRDQAMERYSVVHASVCQDVSHSFGRVRCVAVLCRSAKLAHHGEETARCRRLVHRDLHAITCACVFMNE